MKVEIEGKYIRIKGKNIGEKRHLKIYCDDTDHKDIFTISIVKDGMEFCGIMSNLEMDKDHIIKISLTQKEFID